MHRSALARMSTSPDAEKWSRLIELGQVRITTTTLLEIGHLARSEREWSELVEARALEIQRIVLRGGRHRAPSVPDLLVAAVAEEADLTVLHADNDVDLITRTTGQPVERLRA